MSEPLKDALGQTVIVENRTGASAHDRRQHVAKATPDGHMLLMATSGEIAINQHLYKDKMTYDPTPRAHADRAHRDRALRGGRRRPTPVHNPKELIAYAKANTGKLSFSSSGVGNPQQIGRRADEHDGRHQCIARALPRRGAGGDRRRDRRRHHELHQPRGGAAADQGRQGARGRRHLEGPHAAIAGRGAAERRRAGLAGYELLNWFGMFATGGTPSEIVDRLNDIVNTALIDSVDFRQDQSRKASCRG